jgi:hypothetical protein
MSFPTYHLPIEGANHANAEMAIGTRVVDENGNIYEYVQNKSATASAKGAPAFTNGTKGQMVKNANKLLAVAAQGAWTGAVTADYYGFILKVGYAEYLLGNTGTAAGELLYAGADIWDTGVIGTHQVQGQSYTVDTASVFTGVINAL